MAKQSIKSTTAIENEQKYKAYVATVTRIMGFTVFLNYVLILPLIPDYRPFCIYIFYYFV